MTRKLEARIETVGEECQIYTTTGDKLATVFMHPDSSAEEMTPEEADAQFELFGWERVSDWFKGERGDPWLWYTELEVVEA